MQRRGASAGNAENALKGAEIGARLCETRTMLIERFLVVRRLLLACSRFCLAIQMQ